MPEAGPTHVKMSRREWIVVALLVVSVVINYVDRSNLSLAVPILEKQFSVSAYRAGELLAAFFWTYALVQVFGLAGWLADHFHAGWVLFLGYLLWSLATAATGLTASFAALFAFRLLLGIGESVAYPCYSRIFATMPQEHRGRANSLIDAGTKLGPAAGAFVGGIVLVHFGWRMLFLCFGLGALVWLPLWYWAMPHGSMNSTPQPANERTEPRNVPAARELVDSGNPSLAVRVGIIHRPFLRKLLLLFFVGVAACVSCAGGASFDRCDVAADVADIHCNRMLDAGVRIRFRPADRERRVAKHCAAQPGVGRTGDRIRIDSVLDGSRACAVSDGVDVSGGHRAGRVHVEPLGGYADPGRTCHGGALVEPAKRICELFRDRGAVADRTDSSKRRKHATGVYGDWNRYADWRDLVRVASAAGGAG